MLDQTDKKWIEQAKKSPEAFVFLYQKYHHKIFNYFWYRLNHHDALSDDLTQETFLKAFESIGRFQDRGYSYQTYLFTIAHNVLSNFFRSKKFSDLENVERIPDSFLEHLQSRLELQEIWRAVKRLPRQQKNAFLLRYREDHSVREIAQIMRQSENSVKLLLSRARTRLRRQNLRGIALLPSGAAGRSHPHFLGSRH